MCFMTWSSSVQVLPPLWTFMSIALNFESMPLPKVETLCLAYAPAPFAKLAPCGCLVAKSCLALYNPMNCSPPGRLLCPWDFPGKHTRGGCHSSSRGSSWPRDWTCISLTFSALAGGILYHCITWELQTHHLYLSDNAFLIIIVN